ncbi:hypothetical protein F7R20_23735 [Pseudomonas brassicacearum subsp. brassicacearum]|nr:hypothetical protein F7R20_23735 [Pseudomonas brassicacearum subsp. brassicacearum]QEO77230.1 hypothetical protein ELZ14_06580 [Pseudomonas brassicacearum]
MLIICWAGQAFISSRRNPVWSANLWEQSLLAIAISKPAQMLHVTVSSRASFAPTGLLPGFALTGPLHIGQQ